MSYGAYSHPNIAYHGSGKMVATGAIEAEALLLTIPKSIMWRLCSSEDSTNDCEVKYATSIIKHRDYPTHFQSPMLRQLPTACNGPVCKPKDYSRYSRAFWDFIESSVPPRLSEEEVVVLSVVRSYWWGERLGMIPLMHLFNHDATKGSHILDVFKDGEQPMGNGAKQMGAIAAVDYEEGDEIFFSYNSESQSYGSATLFYLWGFLADTEHDSCHDMIHLRHPDHSFEDKVSCLEGTVDDDSFDVTSVIEEVATAAAVGDWAWVVGGGAAVQKVRKENGRESRRRGRAA